MAPGLSGRQTGAVPKNKPKNVGSQSNRLAQDPLIQLPLDWEPVTESGNKNRSRIKGGTNHSETEVDLLRYDLCRSSSSTMTSQNENLEAFSQDSLPGKTNLPDRKQVASKLSQIQSYIQQTAALMNSLKVSDSSTGRSQYDKLSVMLDDLRDSETKLSGILKKMDNTESRVDTLLTSLEEQQGNNIEADEQELNRRSDESKKKLEVLQKRKEDLLKLQEKAKKQLQEAQAEQSRLVARASSLNEELSTNKVMNLNVQQLSQRLKAVQQLYNTRIQINDNLNENDTEGDYREEDHREISDTETDFQIVSDKMEELNTMKAQLSQIHKIMSSINGMQSDEDSSLRKEAGDITKEPINPSSLNSSATDGEQSGEEGNNLMKLEKAKTKLNHLTQLLDLVQSVQNSTGLPPSYLQIVSNLVNDETNSSNSSPFGSVKSLSRNIEDVSVETMQVMTRELEEKTAAMKVERDKLLAARQELQNMAKNNSLSKSEYQILKCDDDSENEPPCLKPTTPDSSHRDLLTGSGITEAEQNYNEGSSNVCKTTPSRNKQRGVWNTSLSSLGSTSHERRCKNETLLRASNQSSRVGSRNLGRDQLRWSPSPSASVCNERSNPVVQTQNQLEMTGNLCELMLSESLQKGIQPGEISIQDMFNQHQLLTRTVAQCSQLIWLQQKQIIELRNAFMLQCGGFLNPQWQHMTLAQPQINPSLNSGLPFPGISNSAFPYLNHLPSVSGCNQPNCHSMNSKLNSGGIHNASAPVQDLSEQFLNSVNQTALPFTTPDPFGFDMRFQNFNRSNLAQSNTNVNVSQSSGSNSRVANGINCMVPEDSGALNNQVPPGNRANNYWDNFRSYSRQNLLSNPKSNEDTETSRRSWASSSQERLARDSSVPPSHNNHTSSVNHTTSISQQLVNQGNSESSVTDQYLLPPSQNSRVNHQQITRSRSVEPQNLRNPGKNESRNQESDSRIINVVAKNEASGGARSRNSECASDSVRHVRNDVSYNRNCDNLNTTRNFVHLVREFDNEETMQGNNKKRVERTRCVNEDRGNLNNRGYHNIGLWENIYSEVSNFIRANESRPHFLLQLFRELQQVTSDNLRQRILELIQEMISANNLTYRASNMTSGNLNVVENRNNIRENRSNLNRNQTEDPNIDELFCHLRENQNTIRQNIGMSSFIFGGNNLENPNISNIRDLSNLRNNLESEGLRDLRTYYEANLCNFGHNSTLENPNLSNIRENLTRRVSGISDYENSQPKNLYLSLYDNAAVRIRRRNQEPNVPEFESSFRNFESGGEYDANHFSVNNGSTRPTNNQFELENFEGSVREESHFVQEERTSSSRYPVLEVGDNFIGSRQYLSNANDSGIDINFNNEERKRIFGEEDTAVSIGSVKTKNNGVNDVEGAAALILPEWERNEARETFDSSLTVTRNEIPSAFISVCDNSFYNCRTFQQLDNGDLAEADQSRNEETSGAESDSGFVNLQIVEPETGFSSDQNPQTSDNFSSHNIPESERNLLNSVNETGREGFTASERENNSGFPNLSSEQEGKAVKSKGNCEIIQKNEVLKEGYYYHHVDGSSSSDSSVPKSSGMKFRKKKEDLMEKEPRKNSNRFRGNSLEQRKFVGSSNEDFDNSKTDSELPTSVVDGCQKAESRDSADYGSFKLVFENGIEPETGNTSPEAEAEADWECANGLDQVPTRLNKNSNGSLKKSSQ